LEIRTALWATAENLIFFADAMDLKLGWCRPSLILFIYIHFFSIHRPFKGYGKLLKTAVQFCAMVIDFALWPIAHNKILRYGP
jgi:hypothetical protein